MKGFMDHNLPENLNKRMSDLDKESDAQETQEELLYEDADDLSHTPEERRRHTADDFKVSEDEIDNL